MHKSGSSFSADDVEILEKQVLYSGYYQLDQYRLRFRLFAGGWSSEITRSILERGHAAGVLSLSVPP